MRPCTGQACCNSGWSVLTCVIAHLAPCAQQVAHNPGCARAPLAVQGDVRPAPTASGAHVGMRQHPRANSAERTAWLPAFLRDRNARRPHASLGLSRRSTALPLARLPPQAAQGTVRWPWPGAPEPVALGPLVLSPHGIARASHALAGQKLAKYACTTAQSLAEASTYPIHSGHHLGNRLCTSTRTSPALIKP